MATSLQLREVVQTAIGAKTFLSSEWHTKWPCSTAQATMQELARLFPLAHFELVEVEHTERAIAYIKDGFIHLEQEKP